MKNSIRIILALALLFSFLSCGEEEVRNTGLSPVLIKINLSSGRDGALNTPGGYIIYTPNTYHTGSEFISQPGVLAFRNFVIDNNSGKFGLTAYDLRCPHENSPIITITPSADYTATCSKCGSVYDLNTGHPKPGPWPSQQQLKYHSVQNGSSSGEDFIIYN